MPELPEVETIVRELKKTKPPLEGVVFYQVWTDFERMIKKPKKFSDFKKEIIGKKITKIWRRGKNILFDLSSGKTLLIHLKLTGHLLLGKWKLEGKKWVSQLEGPIKDDPINSYLHLIFTFNDQRQLALSDLRKFAKAEILTQEELEKLSKSLGPEPLEKNFSFQKFKEILPPKGKIKKILMDQKIIAGIGNIYSDEILWSAKIHPFKDVKDLKEEELKNIYFWLKKILQKSITLKGESISDFRRLNGEKGNFDLMRKVYRRENEKCERCGHEIKRDKINGRSTYFCSFCQKK